MMFKKKTISIVLSLIIAVTFMPITGQIAFAVETDSTETTDLETTDPETTFNSATAVTDLKRVGYTYKSVTIGWSAVENATGYQVYSATKKSGTYKRICTTASLNFYDKNNKTLGKYRYYKVRAYGVVNEKTTYGQFSSIYAARPDMPAPVVSTSGSSSKITVSWSKVSGATKYRLYRATSPNGNYKRLTKTTKRSYTGSSVTKNKKYFYKVRATRGSYKGYYSKVVEGITILTAPSAVYVSNNPDGGINVSWSGVSNASEYQVLRSLYCNSGFQVIGTANTTSFTDTDASLESGTTYFYKVKGLSSINGTTQGGYLSTGTYREAAVAQATAWIGANEGSSTQKKIVSIYNSKTKVGKISYKTSWCAAFVSAVGISSGNSSIIPIHCYCPTLLKKFSKSARKKYTYVPTGGDLTFYDWNNNNVPDHIGMVSSADNETVSTIEGNSTISNKYSEDSVRVRTYPNDWAKKYVLAYCVPAYNEKGRITYNYSAPIVEASAFSIENPVDDTVVDEAVEAVESGTTGLTPSAEQNLQEPALEQDLQESVPEQNTQEPALEQDLQESVPEQNTQGPENDRETVKSLLNYIEEEDPADESTADDSTFNSFLLLKACEDMGIEACVITEIERDGDEQSHNEIILDGKTYLVDSTKNTITPINYIPKEIN